MSPMEKDVTSLRTHQRRHTRSQSKAGTEDITSLTTKYRKQTLKVLSNEMDLAFEDMHGHWSVLSLNRGRGQFLQDKIIGAPNEIKNQPPPLVRPSSVNFSQHF